MYMYVRCVVQLVNCRSLKKLMVSRMHPNACIFACIYWANAEHTFIVVPNF